MKRRMVTFVAISLLCAFAVPSAFAQGGGASSTGTITGRVEDTSGAVLPGVTVTIQSPSMMGTQSNITSEQGIYRFPAVPPGTYTITYELPGFNTLKREGIQIALGFTATVNVQLQVAALQETVTVTGESPVIDTSATRVQQNFKLEQLQSIPNARDMWSLLAVTPAVMMSRVDVGGNRAGTQTGYTAYGFNGQVRVLIEGINTTEGTGGAGFYFDYASLEEAFFGTTGQSAEMGTPGVQSQFIAKSGGNRFSGEYHLDWYNNTLQGANIPSSYTAATAFNNSPIRPHSNEITGYYDTDINVGGPVKHDKLWWFFTYRDQKNQVQQPNFTFDKTFDTRLWNPVTKWTYQLNQKNKLIGYYQWGQKIQPNRLRFNNYTYTDPGQTYAQDSGSWVYKGEWNSTISDKLYLESRYGVFGYYFPLLANSDEQYYWRDSGTRFLTGAERRWQNDRERKQLTGAATYFLDTGRGSHSIKFGGEYYKESQWVGFQQFVGGNIEHIYRNGSPDQVVFYFPTATDAGKLRLGRTGDLLQQNKLDQQNAFITDTWNWGRVTMNLGMRWDRYVSWIPDQVQLAATSGPISIPAQDCSTNPQFCKTTFFTWNSAAPRLGFIYDLSGNGRTVIKANYGLFYHNPGPDIAADANPNAASKSVTYGWNDANRDKKWQPGEETNLLDSALAGAIALDPSIKQPYTHEAGVFFEHQLATTIGSRVGFVYKTEDDLTQTYRPGRGISAYSVPFQFLDIGVNGVRDTATGATTAAGDDRFITLYGVPSANAATLFPVNRVIQNVPQYGRYKTIEASVNKRFANRWSMSAGGSHTWRRNFPENFANDANAPGVEDRTTWDFKLTGTYEAPYGIRFSPVLRHQAGVNFARTIDVPSSAAAAFGLIYSGTIYADSADSHRQDNITLVDTRIEKVLNVSGDVRVRAFVDLFNITNTHASETITTTTGTSYLKPSAILAPRTARLGFRFMW